VPGSGGMTDVTPKREAGLDQPEARAPATEVDAEPPVDAPESAACSRNGAALCDDFEQYAAGSVPGGVWTSDVRGGGALQVDSTRRYSGTKSLHITGSVSAARANLSTAIRLTADTTFVRFMMYTVAYPSSSGVHTRLMRLGTTAAAGGGPDTSYSFSSYNGTAIEKVNSIYLRDTSVLLNQPSLKNRWVCWEFAIDKAGGIGNVKPHIWLDGAELPLAAAGSSTHGMTSTSWDPIAFDVFLLGLEGYQDDAVGADFWLDDLVVSTSRVKCASM